MTTIPPLHPPLAIRPKVGKNCPNFPTVLFYMLLDLDQAEDNKAISWSEHGRCVVVHDKHLFAKTYLPLWFQMRSYCSFQRQLNMYGFKRIADGADKGGYYHGMFLRGNENLLKHIERFAIKGKLSAALPRVARMVPFLNKLNLS